MVDLSVLVYPSFKSNMQITCKVMAPLKEEMLYIYCTLVQKVKIIYAVKIREK